MHISTHRGGSTPEASGRTQESSTPQSYGQLLKQGAHKTTSVLGAVAGTLQSGAGIVGKGVFWATVIVAGAQGAAGATPRALLDQGPLAGVRPVTMSGALPMPAGHMASTPLITAAELTASHTLFRRAQGSGRAPKRPGRRLQNISGGGAPITGDEGGKAGIAKAEGDTLKQVLSTKKVIDENIKDPTARVIAVAIAGAESAFDNQKVLSDQTPPGSKKGNQKKGTDMEEISVFRLNRGMLKELKYSDDEIEKMRTGADLPLAAKALQKAIATFGIGKFEVWHRGGETGRKTFEAGKPPAWDDQIYIDGISRVTQTIKNDPAFLTDGRWPWIYIPPK